MKNHRFLPLFVALVMLISIPISNVSVVQAQSAANQHQPPILVLTKLTIQLLEPATVGKSALISFQLTTGDGTPRPHKLIKIFLDGTRQKGIETDVDGHASLHFRRDVAGTYVLTAIYNGDQPHRIGPARASIEIVVKPALVEIHAVPPVAGITFFLDNRIFTTDQTGVAKIEVQQIGDYVLQVLPLETPRPDIQVAFKRWGDDTYTSSRTINIPKLSKPMEVGFELSYQVSQTFANQTGEPVESERIGSITIKGSDGGVETFENNQPHWLVSNHVTRLKGGLQETKILYYVTSVVIDGSNVVYESQQRFYANRNDVWPIQLLLYSIHFTAHDALFHFPTGSGIRLEYPNGKTQTFPFDSVKEFGVNGLARGMYRVTLLGVRGMAPATPIALSRDQEVDLKVLSLLDLGVVFSAGLVLALGLLAIGRLRSLRKLPAVRDRGTLQKKNKQDEYPKVPGFAYQETVNAVAIVPSSEQVILETDVRGEKGLPGLPETEAPGFVPDNNREILFTTLEVQAVDAEPKCEKPPFSSSTTNTTGFVQSDNSEVSLRSSDEDQVENTGLDITIPTCKVCGSSNIIKNGRNRHGKGQKYRCRACGSYRIQVPTQIVQFYK
jgi:hypothetical protein